MTRSLVHAAYYVHRTLGGPSVQRYATDAAAAYLIDTYALKQPDDYWGGNGAIGTLYLTQVIGQGDTMQFARVNDFTQSTSRLDLLDNLSPVPQGNDRYAVFTPRYPLDLVIDKINQALQEWGGILKTDTTSLDAAPSTLEYTLPEAEMSLREVWVRTGESNDPVHWMELRDWYVQKSATGSASKLVFRHVPNENRDLKLVYVAPHPHLDYNSDEIDEGCPFEAIVAHAAMLCVEDRLLGLTDKDPNIRNQLELLQQKYARLRTDSPRQYPPRKPNLFVVGGRH